MKITCPCCGETFPIEAGFAEAEGKQLAALLADCEPKLARQIMAYLRLFSPAKRALRTSRAIKLIEDLMALVASRKVQRDARTNEVRDAPQFLWINGIEQMLAQREKLQLPLENHNYLRAVVWGLAAEPGTTQLAATPLSMPKPDGGSNIVAQKAYGLSRITGDLTLGLISQEEANRRIARLNGTQQE